MTGSIINQAPIHRQRCYDTTPARPTLFVARDYTGQLKRIGAAALPFISLHQSIAPITTAFSQTLRLISSAEQWRTTPSMSSRAHLIASMATVIAFTFFSKKLGILCNTGHDLALTMNDVYKHLLSGTYREACADITRVAIGVLYASAILFLSTELQIGSLALQMVVESISASIEWKNGYYLEAAAHIALASIYANRVSAHVPKAIEKLGMTSLCHRIAYHMFRLGHICSVPIHATAFAAYTFIQNGAKGDSLHAKAQAIGALCLRGCISIVALPLTLSFSACGALLLKMAGTSYLYTAYNQEQPFTKEGGASLLTYNVGLLPGELAEKLTVGEFEYSHAERQARLVDFLARESLSHDVLLLEEANDFGFMDALTARLADSGAPVHIYSRISHNPLSPGIPSGLSIISHTPLDLHIGDLPESEPFFNRAFALFRFNDTQIVHTHLYPGADDAIRFRQLAHIAEALQPGGGILIGDYNFSDAGRDEIGQHIPSLGPVRHYVETPTMADPIEGEQHPDMVATFGTVSAEITVSIDRETRLSDHLPIHISV